MTRFFVAPYPPTDDPEQWELAKSASTLEIDPEAYERDLRARWPEVVLFSSSDVLPLQWEIREQGSREGMVSGTIASLHSDRSVVSMDTPFEEFILWHRQVIPEEHRLFLFNDSSWEYLELEPHTTIEVIRRFVGGSPVEGEKSST